ncbi:unnamed protein product [Meloidogyne enterolobii]|uniref:Uncharacterized protein n=1 Tax=Meloidogyne enterolobii TaxID=390850 RepID=A0ACB1AI72_MELEN
MFEFLEEMFSFSRTFFNGFSVGSLLHDVLFHRPQRRPKRSKPRAQLAAAQLTAAQRHRNEARKLQTYAHHQYIKINSL